MTYPSIRDIAGAASIADRAKTALLQRHSLSASELTVICKCTSQELFSALRNNLDFKQIGGKDGWFFSLYKFAAVEHAKTYAPVPEHARKDEVGTRVRRERCDSNRSCVFRALSRLGVGSVNSLAVEMGVSKAAIYQSIKRFQDGLIIERSTPFGKGPIVSIRLKDPGGAPTAQPN